MDGDALKGFQNPIFPETSMTDLQPRMTEDGNLDVGTWDEGFR